MFHFRRSEGSINFFFEKVLDEVDRGLRWGLGHVKKTIIPFFQNNIKIPHFYFKQRSRFIFRYLIVKKSLKGLLLNIYFVAE